MEPTSDLFTPCTKKSETVCGFGKPIKDEMTKPISIPVRPMSAKDRKSQQCFKK